MTRLEQFFFGWRIGEAILSAAPGRSRLRENGASEDRAPREDYAALWRDLGGEA